jgi:hypothetical protein
MKTRKFSLEFFCVVLAFGLAFVGCDNGTPGNGNGDGGDDGIVSKQTISSKWEIKDAGSRYSSFEFTADGIYIVIENQEMPSYSMRSAISVFAEARATNLSPIHTGVYQIDGNNIILEGFGVIEIISFTAEEFIFSFTIENSGEKYEYNTKKVENAIDNSSRTALLCHYWKISSITPPVYDNRPTHAIFSNAGTYLVTYADGTAGLSEWKWGDAGETFIQYSWDNWKDVYDWPNTYVKVLRLTSSNLKLQEKARVFELVLEQ